MSIVSTILICNIVVAKHGEFISATKRGTLQVISDTGINGTLEDVLFCPEAPYNLLSVSRMQRAGLTITFDQHGTNISKDGTILMRGSLGAWQSDIDINRVQLIKNEDTQYRPRNPHSRRSVLPYKFRHDNDHHSSRIDKLRPSMHLVSDSQTTEPTALKVHQPREDPRLFYQSDTYAKEVDENRLNNEVTAVYPGKDVVRASGSYYRKPARLRERGTNDVPYDDLCVTCPQDRTVIARPGSDRVMLQYPRLKSCYGYRVPRDVRFVPMYGPEFGTLLQKGSHGILGHIKYKDKMLRYCYMTVHVLIQTCTLPKYLIADCGDGNKTCSFTCRDPKAELHGSSSLTCGADMQWGGPLPVCSARTWCEPQSPPAHGRVSCKGSTTNGGGLAEGSICRVKCAREWKSNTRPVAVCRGGAWTNAFTCTTKINL